jgi:hypothetical protein
VTPQVPDITDPEPVPPQCRATVERIQRVLDGSLTAEGAAELEGETSPGALTGAGDTHLVACAACRERVRAARVLLSVLALPPEPAPVPTAFTDRVLTAVAADRGVAVRRSERRERAARVTAWAALAAAIVVGMFYLAAREQRPGDPRGSNPVETAGPLPPAPVPRESPDPTPAPRPVRLGDEFAKAGQALRDAPKPLAESVAVAPKLFDAFTEPFKGPVAQPNPMGAVIEPARRSIAELPVAVRAGLEPVTGTAEKAFNRFLRDVGAAKPNS